MVKGTSETLSSLDNYDIDYLLKLYEYLTFEEYIEAIHNKDMDIKRGQRNTIKQVDNWLAKLNG